MKTDRELLNLALKLVAKYHARETVLVDWEKSVIEAINARLAEDDDEPVAWITWSGDIFRQYESASVVETGKPCPLYRRPAPARKPLSEDEIEEIHREFPSRIDLFVRAIEKAHGIGETE